VTLLTRAFFPAAPAVVWVVGSVDAFFVIPVAAFAVAAQGRSGGAYTLAGRTGLFFLAFHPARPAVIRVIGSVDAPFVIPVAFAVAAPGHAGAARTRTVGADLSVLAFRAACTTVIRVRLSIDTCPATYRLAAVTSELTSASRG
jgi:hypothetical protein